jgi:DHA1 family bicyclomycin/chloramphenicol resistance-like MFS transporter
MSGPADAPLRRPARLPSVLVLGGLVALGPLSVDMYLPALPAIARDFGAPYAAVQQSLSAFVFGLGAGQLLCGPLSDRVGRRPVLALGLVLYVAASAALALAQDVPQLVLLRLLQALGGAAGVVLARAIVRDLYQGAEVARALSFVMLVTGVAPLVAPLIGGWLLLLAGWRAIFGLLATFGILILVAARLILPETRRRAGTSPGLGRTFLLPLADRETLGFILTGGFAFAGMFAYIAATPFVYIELFGVPPQRYGLLFGLNVIGIMTGSFASARLVGRLGVRRLLGLGTAVIALAGVALLIITHQAVGGLVPVVVALFFYVGMMGLIGANSVAGALERFPESAGGVSALLGATQFGFGALAGVVIGLLHDGTAAPMGIVIGSCGVAALGARLLLVR